MKLIWSVCFRFYIGHLLIRSWSFSLSLFQVKLKEFEAMLEEARVERMEKRKVERKARRKAEAAALEKAEEEKKCE